MDKLQTTRENIEALDKTMAACFVQRMKYAEEIAQLKKDQNLPIEDLEREQELLNKNLAFLPEELQEEYKTFFSFLVSLSKKHQQDSLEK